MEFLQSQLKTITDMILYNEMSKKDKLELALIALNFMEQMPIFKNWDSVIQATKKAVKKEQGQEIDRLNTVYMQKRQDLEINRIIATDEENNNSRRASDNYGYDFIQ